MVYTGIVQNGVIVFPPGTVLPEGSPVRVEIANPPTDSDGKTLAQRLAELAQWAEELPSDLPTDLSKQHDHYLYGTPKR